MAGEDRGAVRHRRRPVLGAPRPRAPQGGRRAAARARARFRRAARALAGASRRAGRRRDLPALRTAAARTRRARPRRHRHTRGGRLAVEAAAYLKPQLVIAVYPGTINMLFEPATNFRKIPHSTNIYIFVGDRDHGVGNAGALELNERLLAFDFPAGRIHGAVIRSTPRFTADHMSVYDLGAPAQKAIWARVDRLIARVRR